MVTDRDIGNNSGWGMFVRFMKWWIKERVQLPPSFIINIGILSLISRVDNRLVFLLYGSLIEMSIVIVWCLYQFACLLFFKSIFVRGGPL